MEIYWNVIIATELKLMIKKHTDQAKLFIICGTVQ